MPELTPLQAQAAKMLGRGINPKDTRDHLQLALSTFESWREDSDFNDAVETEKLNSGSENEAAVLMEAASAFGLLDAAPVLTPNDSKETFYDPDQTK